VGGFGEVSKKTPPTGKSPLAPLSQEGNPPHEGNSPTDEDDSVVEKHASLTPLSKGVAAQRRGDFRHYKPQLKSFSRLLRANLTDAEKKLWFHLRRKQLGVQFYRQKPIANFIVDFYCASAKLVIEIDGGQHFETVGLKNDQARDQMLRALGLRVLRVDNHQVLQETDAVLQTIQSSIGTSQVEFHGT
jgi:very-short-patch-repair endonuclease